MLLESDNIQKENELKEMLSKQDNLQNSYEKKKSECGANLENYLKSTAYLTDINNKIAKLEEFNEATLKIVKLKNKLEMENNKNIIKLDEDKRVLELKLIKRNEEINQLTSKYENVKREKASLELKIKRDFKFGVLKKLDVFTDRFQADLDETSVPEKGSLKRTIDSLSDAKNKDEIIVGHQKEPKRKVILTKKFLFL